MKSVRKSIALLLALVMVLALSTAAFAAPVTYLETGLYRPQPRHPQSKHWSW